MIKQLLSIALFAHTCSLYPHKPVATHFAYESFSHTVGACEWDIARLQLLASLLMGGSVITGNETVHTIAAIVKKGPSEERIDSLIAWSTLTPLLLAAGVYCFEKAERMS